MTRVLALVSVLLFGFSSQARWQKMSEADSVVNRFDLRYTVNKDGSYSDTVEYVWTIQAEDAKSNAGVFRIEYNGDTDKVNVLEAYTQNGKDRIQVDASNIEDRDKGEARDYDVQRIRSITFPQVKVGSVLHVRYQTVVKKPVIKDRWSGEMLLQPSIYVQHFTLSVKSALPLYEWLKDPMHLLKITQQSQHHLFAENVKPLPGWVHGEKNPYFSPVNATELWLSTQSNWEEFMRPLAQDYAKVLAAGLPNELEPWIAEAKKKTNPTDQVLYLMGRMSREFRYFGDWRRLNGGLVPRKLQDIAHSRYGDCKDLATLLTSMLGALKIEAHVALVRRGENPYGFEPDYKLPGTDHFNHAIVAARLQGHTYWLDATNPVGSMRPYDDIAGRPAWLLSNGGGHFERVPAATPQDYVHVHRYAYHFLKNGAVDVDLKVQLKGMAPFRLANELMSMSRSDVLTSTLDYFSEGQEVSSFHYPKEPSTTRELKNMNFGLDYRARGVTYHAGRDRFFVIPDGFLSGAFYETEGRESDIRLYDEPMLFNGERRLKNVRLEQPLPKPCHISSRWMDLNRKISVEGHDVVIRQTVDLKRPYITHEEFRTPAFHTLQASARRCFYRGGLLINALK